MRPASQQLLEGGPLPAPFRRLLIRELRLPVEQVDMHRFDHGNQLNR